jgi:glutaredoxin
MNYILYGTSACHLCEAAEAIILPIQQTQGFRLQKVDIAEDDTLIAQYGSKIPVLYCKQTKQTLEWPFDASQLNHFLEARNKTSTQ